MLIPLSPENKKIAKNTFLYGFLFAAFYLLFSLLFRNFFNLMIPENVSIVTDNLLKISSDRNTFAIFMSAIFILAFRTNKILEEEKMKNSLAVAIIPKILLFLIISLNYILQVYNNVEKFRMATQQVKIKMDLNLFHLYQIPILVFALSIIIDAIILRKIGKKYIFI